MPEVGRKAPNATHVQSVLFDREEWEKKDARKWLKDHDYYTDGFDETDTLYRFRQYDPEESKFRYRNKDIGDGIMLVNGFPKSKSDKDETGFIGAICCGDESTPADHFFLGYVNEKQVLAASKAELYKAYQEALAAGEIFKLRVSGIPHRNGLSNANFWRMKPGAYKAVAKSFVGQPFQRNHSLRQEDRGGTIISSKAIGSGDEAYMLQEWEVVEPWAIEGFLRGTVDRFSIHLNSHDIKASCSICGLSAFDYGCQHWPGMAYETDRGEQVCWFVVSEATGKETSAVVDPAVANTGIEQMIQLAASKRGTTPPSEKEEDMDEIKGLQAKIASLEEELSAKTEALENADTLLAAKDAEAAGLQGKVEGFADLVQQMDQKIIQADLRICEDLRANLTETIASNQRLTDLTIQGDEDENTLRRILLATKVILEKDRRGKICEDVSAEVSRLQNRETSSLQDLLTELRDLPLPQDAPPMGRGFHLTPETDISSETKAATKEEDQGVDEASIEDVIALSSGRARMF